MDNVELYVKISNDFQTISMALGKFVAEVGWIFIVMLAIGIAILWNQIKIKKLLKQTLADREQEEKTIKLLKKMLQEQEDKNKP